MVPVGGAPETLSLFRVDSISGDGPFRGVNLPVTDRLTPRVIEAAEQSGQLKPGQTGIGATSDDAGIGLAMMCAQKGYPLVITMAERRATQAHVASVACQHGIKRRQ